MRVMLERIGANGQVERIEVNIDEWGNIEATVKDIDGPRCGEVSAFLNDLGVVTEDSPTADYYNTVSEADTDYLTGGGF